MGRYIQLRPSGYYLRYTLNPSDRILLAKRELKRSLRTRSKVEAKRRAESLVAHLCFTIRNIRKQHMEKLSRESVQKIIDNELRRRLTELEEEHLSREKPLTPNETRELLLDSSVIPEITHYKASSDLSVVETYAEKVANESGFTVDRQSLAFRKLCASLLSVMRTELKANDALLKGEDIEQFYPTNQEVPPTQSKPTSPKLSECLRGYLDDKQKGGKISEKTAGEYRSAVKTVIFILGDKPVSEYTYADAVRFRDTCMQLPTHRNKRKEYRDKTLSELLEMDIPEQNRLKSKSIYDMKASITAIFDWCKAHKYTQDNPFTELDIKVESSSYSPFSIDDLNYLFRSPLYDSVAPYRSKRGERSRWWLPLFALYSGARLSEIVQMRLSDIRTDPEGILFASVIDDPDEGKRVKTDAGRRKFPIHPKLLDIGFGEYVAELERKGEVVLFPNLAQGRYTAGGMASKWFTKYRNNHLVKISESGGRKVFHSFRHTFITEANNKNMNHRHRLFMVGHASGERQDRSANKVYDHGETTMKPYLESISVITYDGLKIDHLKDDWKRLQP